MTIVADPVAWLWLALLLASSLLVWRHKSKTGGVLLALCVVLAGFEAFSIPTRLLAGLEYPYLNASRSVPAPADAVVVCGGGASSSAWSLLEIEFNESGDRLFTGVELVRRGAAKTLVLSGWGPRRAIERSEASSARNWIAHWSLLATPVETLGPGLNTHDEARLTVELARQHNWKRVILVTSAWHMRRALGAFRKAGLEVVPVGCDFVGTGALADHKRLSLIPQMSTFMHLNLWMREVIGYRYYRVRGWC